MTFTKRSMCRLKYTTDTNNITMWNASFHLQEDTHGNRRIQTFTLRLQAINGLLTTRALEYINIENMKYCI